jgi:hypothetical protein
MTKKLQRMTPNPTFLNPTSNCSKNLPQKLKKLPHILGKIAEGRIDGRIHPKFVPSPFVSTPLLLPPATEHDLCATFLFRCYSDIAAP